MRHSALHSVNTVQETINTVTTIKTLHLKSSVRDTSKNDRELIIYEI